MAGAEIRYRWEWELESPPELLWPLVADTNRFNHDTGAPEVEADEGREPLENGRRALRFRVLGRDVPYEEEPFEWIRPQRFGVLRRYRSGPLAELRVRLELTPRPGGGSHLAYEVVARPRGLAGRLAVPLTIGRVARKRMDETFRSYDRIAAGEARESRRPDDRLPPGARERLARGRRELEAAGVAPDLADRLVEEVERGDPLSLARLRPYAVADEWGVERRSVLELFLYATRAGVLDLRWEVLCPLCRGAKQATRTLAGLHRGVHCDACNIDFDASLERSVELTFRPNPSVREIEVHDYCVGGPQVTPHIVAQQLIAPGEGRTSSSRWTPAGTAFGRSGCRAPGTWRSRRAARRRGRFASAPTAGLLTSSAWLHLQRSRSRTRPPRSGSWCSSALPGATRLRPRQR